MPPAKAGWAGLTARILPNQPTCRRHHSVAGKIQAVCAATFPVAGKMPALPGAMPPNPAPIGCESAT